MGIERLPGLGGSHGVREDRIGRTRAAVRASRLTIARSRERIDNSLRAVEQSAESFSFPPPPPFEVAAPEIAESHEAAIEQREIEREVRRTTRAADRLFETPSQANRSGFRPLLPVELQSSSIEMRSGIEGTDVAS